MNYWFLERVQYFYATLGKFQMIVNYNKFLKVIAFPNAYVSHIFGG